MRSAPARPGSAESGVQAEATGTELQETARYGDVLEEVEELILVAQSYAGTAE